MKLLFVILAIVLAVSGEKARFDNYRVYSITIDTHDQLSALRQLSETSDSYTFWDEPSGIKQNIDVLVPPHKFADFGELVTKFQLTVDLVNNNFQETIDKEAVFTKTPKAAMDWVSYKSTDEIHEWLATLPGLYPGIVTVEDIGRSYEGKLLKLVKISKKPGNRAIFVEGNMHAREWISGATSTYLINELLTSTDPEIQEIASNVDWHIIPISNPDGYEYSRSTNRQWRKSRIPSSLTCFGVDLNRNWGYNWLVADETGNLGASTNPCSDTYAGPRAFSEPESIAINHYLEQHHAAFDVYLSFHSYAHMILFPWGHTKVPIENYDVHTSIGNAAGDALYAKHGVRYEIGGSNIALYATSGTSVDHAVGQYKIPIGYTYEMRGNGDYGRYGFVLPPQFIIPNGEEVVQSLVALVARSRTYGYLS